jgi:hypothetical protein
VKDLCKLINQVNSGKQKHVPFAEPRLKSIFSPIKSAMFIPVLHKYKSPKPRPLLTPSDRQVGILRQSKIFLSGALPKKR